MNLLAINNLFRLLTALMGNSCQRVHLSMMVNISMTALVIQSCRDASVATGGFFMESP